MLLVFMKYFNFVGVASTFSCYLIQLRNSVYVAIGNPFFFLSLSLSFSNIEVAMLGKLHML